MRSRSSEDTSFGGGERDRRRGLERPGEAGERVGVGTVSWVSTQTASPSSRRDPSASASASFVLMVGSDHAFGVEARATSWTAASVSQRTIVSVSTGRD